MGLKIKSSLAYSTLSHGIVKYYQTYISASDVLDIFGWQGDLDTKTKVPA